MTQNPNLFESLKLRIWILFVICYLVLGVFSIQGPQDPQKELPGFLLVDRMIGTRGGYNAAY